MACAMSHGPPVFIPGTDGPGVHSDSCLKSPLASALSVGTAPPPPTIIYPHPALACAELSAAPPLTAALPFANGVSSEADASALRTVLELVDMWATEIPAKLATTAVSSAQ